MVSGYEEYEGRAPGKAFGVLTGADGVLFRSGGHKKRKTGAKAQRGIIDSLALFAPVLRFCVPLQPYSSFAAASSTIHSSEPLEGSMSWLGYSSELRGPSITSFRAGALSAPATRKII